MSAVSPNETWVVDKGDLIIRKKAREGMTSLTPWELLVYCLWVADYGMRNAGDLETAGELYSLFQTEAARSAAELNLPQTTAAFSLAPDDLEKEYFDRFEAICDEIRQTEGGRA